MKSVLEGEIELDEALPYVDRCLGCLSCVTACPSGVPYEELLTPFREFAEKQRRRSILERVEHELLMETLPDHNRFRLSAKMGKLAKPMQPLLPGKLKDMLSLLPDSLPVSQPLPNLYPANGERRARVALLTGCVQQVLAPQINWATLRVLAYNGVEVVIPPDQGCCGALAMHVGEMDKARGMALHNMEAFPYDVDAIITNAAGCGSAMLRYPMLFAGTQWEEKARKFSTLVQDISVFLEKLGILPLPSQANQIKLAYHDACHLMHAQKVVEAPRKLLEQIPNLILCSIPEAELCCGSAGIYNLEQPETARELGERKINNILGTGAQLVATGNIGCLIQLRKHLEETGQFIPIMHTVEILDRAYFGWKYTG